MFWAFGPVLAAAAANAAAAQAKAQRDSMQAYRDAGNASMKDLLGSQCEYCRGTHRNSYCPGCGAPTKAQQQSIEGGYLQQQQKSTERMRLSVMYGWQTVRPSLEAKLENSKGSQNAEAERKKRRDEDDEDAARRRRNESSYMPSIATPDYSSTDSSPSSDTSYSGGGGSFDGGGASGDY